ncbi:MAG: helix-turn-helix transcriptional regulator [Streptosporangiaceae bacterium]
MMTEKLKGNLDMLLLAVLAAGPGHGYSIITRLRERSDGAFDLPEGTVYPALHRLESSGLLDSAWEVVGGRRRRLYRLTAVGQESLASEARQWRSFSGSVARVLGGMTMPLTAPGNGSCLIGASA